MLIRELARFHCLSSTHRKQDGQSPVRTRGLWVRRSDHSRQAVQSLQAWAPPCSSTPAHSRASGGPSHGDSIRRVPRGWKEGPDHWLECWVHQTNAAMDILLNMRPRPSSVTGSAVGKPPGAASLTSADGRLSGWYGSRRRSTAMSNCDLFPCRGLY